MHGIGLRKPRSMGLGLAYSPRAITRLDDHDRLDACRRTGGRHELAGSGNRLDMQQISPGDVPISGEIVEQITDIDIALVTHRNDGGKAQIPARAPIAACPLQIAPDWVISARSPSWRAWLPAMPAFQIRCGGHHHTEGIGRPNEPQAVIARDRPPPCTPKESGPRSCSLRVMITTAPQPRRPAASTMAGQRRAGAAITTRSGMKSRAARSRWHGLAVDIAVNVGN